jgi:class 3 adenylate cyclase/predicted ATPase
MNFDVKNRDLGLKCPRCDFQNIMDAKSCRECGADLTAACTDCGHKVRTAAKFCDECGAILALSQVDNEVLSELRSSITQPLANRIRPNIIKMKGERKNVTVMFTDISGFTQMSEKLDPEEVINIINSCFNKLTEIIYRYEGTVDKYMGDCIIALFGAPMAHEDDPERAVKTAMEIIESLGELNKSLPFPIQMHVGLNTGLVVAGSIGSDLRKQYTVIGDTVNTASRIQNAAQPGQILVGENVYRLTKDVFDFAEVGEITVKGKKKPIRVYIPLSIRPQQTRFGKAKARGLTPYVGREDELTSLKSLFTKSVKGEGQAVGIFGEAGIGKSRLLYEFIQHLDSDVSYLEGHCMPHGRISPYQPFIEVLRQYLGLSVRVIDKEQKEEDITKQLGSLKEYVSCFEDLLSLPLSDPEYSKLLPPMRRKKIFEGLIALFQHAATIQPLVLALDDLQWLDETSREFLTSLLDVIGSSRILLMLISRPEFEPPWRKHLSYTSIPLSLLHKTDGYRLIQALFDAPISSELEKFILDRTGGNPFFVEELVRALQEAHAVKLNGSYSFTVSSDKLNIPETVQGVLAARMDRLDGETKNTLQIASVIGCELEIPVLEKVSELKGIKLRKQLDILTGTGFMLTQTQKDTGYIFKHVLTKDVAYGSLLKSSRRKLHGEVADSMKQLLPRIIETQPELLAYHYTEADLLDEAISYWQLSGKKAIQRSSNTEAVSHLTKGLELLRDLPSTPMHIQQELELLTTLGPALMATKGPGAADVKNIYDRGRALCERVGQTFHLFPILFGLWRFYLLRANFDVARDLGEKLLSLAQHRDNVTFLLDAYFALGAPSFWRGDFNLAHENFEQVIVLYDPQQHKNHTFLLGQDPLFVCMCYDAFTQWALGYPDQALKKIQEAVAMARGRNHSFSLAYALFGIALIYQLRRDENATRQWAEEVIALSIDKGFPYFSSMSGILRGWSVAEQGNIKEGITLISQSLQAWEITESEVNKTYHLALLAEVHRKNGDIEKGLVVLTEALTTVERNEERWYEAELYRLKGDLLLMHDGAEEEIEGYFSRALEVARKQNAMSFELRAALSLCRLWQKNGKFDEAREMLQNVYERFTEGFETRDLQEAKILLEALQ